MAGCDWEGGCEEEKVPMAGRVGIGEDVNDMAVGKKAACQWQVGWAEGMMSTAGRVGIWEDVNGRAGGQKGGYQWQGNREADGRKEGCRCQGKGRVSMARRKGGCQ